MYTVVTLRLENITRNLMRSMTNHSIDYIDATVYINTQFFRLKFFRESKLKNGIFQAPMFETLYIYLSECVNIIRPG